jgi:asparagine synthase (glutamine-hydrolysing)
MCGIAGIIDTGRGIGREEIERLATTMRDSMTHRGPDDGATWVSEDGRVALAHRRLSIIDLRPEGRQPMANEDGSVQVVFNGEIYNHRALRKELEGKGHAFRSNSDTEVLAHMFEDTSLAQVEKLDGMFAFAAWNARERRLVLARDPFGKKPLYIAEGDGFFAFASEMRALEQLPFLDRTVSRAALAAYLLVQYIPTELAIYDGMCKLNPGDAMSINFDDAQWETRRHFDFEPRRDRETRLTPAEAKDELRRLVRNAVEKRLESDVPLGAFLSGGVDSSLVVAVMAKDFGRKVDTFSIGFDDPDATEHLFARETARLLGTNHRDDVLSPDAMTMLPEIAARLDEPNGDSSCLPTLLLSRFTREHVTVALSGDGGDELFGGYGRYRDTLNEGAMDARGFIDRMKMRLRGQRASTVADRYLSPRWLMFQPERVKELMGGTVPPNAAAQFKRWQRLLSDGARTPLQRMRALDARTYMPGAVLPKVDRMSMQASLEVRCPLLDRELAQFAATLPDALLWQPPQGTKQILKDLAMEYLPREWMERRKMGFGLPAKCWSQAALLKIADDSLGNDAALRDHLDGDALTRFVHEQRDPAQFSIYRLWPMLILELWLRERRRGA